MKLRSGRTIINDVTPGCVVTQDVQTPEQNCKTIYNKLSNEKKLELSVRLKQVRVLTDSFNNDFHEIFEKYPGNAMDNWLKFVLKMPNCDKLSKRKKSQVNSRVKQVGKAIDDFAKDFPEIYTNESIRLVFWLHFLAISLFVGAWIARDCQKFMIPKILSIPCVTITYFAGPVGVLIYWFVRIFYAKQINFND